jgi:Zn-dependent protease
MRLKIGSGFGIPIYLHWTMILVPLLIRFLQPDNGEAELPLNFTVAGLLFVCVVLHEFGHILAARYFGIGTHDVTLYPIGGIARLKRMSEKPHEEFIIAVAGPAVNVVIAFVLGCGLVPALLLQPEWVGHTFAGQAILRLCALNVVMVVFNLLPAFPMDGGRVLRAILASWLDYYQATKIAVGIGAAMAALLAMVGIYFGTFMLVLVAMFVFFAGQQELAALRYREQQRYQEELPLEVLPVRPVGPVATQPYAVPDLLFQPKISVYTWDNQTGIWRKDPASPL